MMNKIAKIRGPVKKDGPNAEATASTNSNAMANSPINIKEDRVTKRARLASMSTKITGKKEQTESAGRTLGFEFWDSKNTIDTNISEAVVSSASTL